MGYVIGLISSPRGPWRPFKWTSKFPRTRLQGSSGEEVYTFDEVIDRVSLMHKFPLPFVDRPPGMEGLGDYGSLPSRLRNKGAFAVKRLVRHFVGVQRASGNGVMGKVPWSSGPNSSAGGLTGVSSGMAPILRILQSCALCPSTPPPLRGATFVGTPSA